MNYELYEKKILYEFKRLNYKATLKEKPWFF